MRESFHLWLSCCAQKGFIYPPQETVTQWKTFLTHTLKAQKHHYTFIRVFTFPDFSSARRVDVTCVMKLCQKPAHASFSLFVALQNTLKYSLTNEALLLLLLMMMLWGYKQYKALQHLFSVKIKLNLKLACGARICHFVHSFANINMQKQERVLGLFKLHVMSFFLLQILPKKMTESCIGYKMVHTFLFLSLHSWHEVLTHFFNTYSALLCPHIE